MKNFGIPYSAPLSPFTGKAMRDVLIRSGFKQLDTKTRIETLDGVTEYENNDISQE